MPLSATPDPLLCNELKVTLVWTDPPAQPLANTPLINNLDLTVQIGAGAPVAGNGAPDRANTVEQVTIAQATGLATVQQHLWVSTTWTSPFSSSR